MKSQNMRKTGSLIVGTALLAATAVAHAGTVPSMDSVDSVLEDSKIVTGLDNFTEVFKITKVGRYQFTLTDFVFPESLEFVGASINSSTNMFGALRGPGMITLDLNPGKYFLHMIAFAGSGLDNPFFDGAPLFDGDVRESIGSFGFDIRPVPTPIPAALWLFGAGVGTLIGVARRKSIA